MKRRIFFLLLIGCAALDAAPLQRIYIVIHGTWAAHTAWHKPGGDFFDVLEEAVAPLHGTIVPFAWSGDNDHFSRKRAAEHLANLIQSYPSSYAVNVIAHSHGANVAILASQLLGKNKKNKNRIHNFYALGTPVSVLSYLPNMEVIHYFYHFYSLSDRIQTVFDLFAREFPEHERCANIRLMINGEEPDHSELHCPLVAAWLPLIHEVLADNKIGDFQHFDFGLHANIYLFDDRKPLYCLDFDRKEALEKDFLHNQRLLAAMIINDRAFIEQ